MATIYAEYSDGCFCERPALNETVKTPHEPRFNFTKAARELAGKLDAQNFQLNKRTAGKSAYAELPHKCAHRDKQAIRITSRYADS